VTTRDLVRTIKRLRIERNLTIRELASETQLAVSRLFIILRDPETAKLQERTKYRLEQWVAAQGGK